MPNTVQGERREIVDRLDSELGAHGGVLLHGPAGIGKTFVAQQLADRARARGDLVLLTGPEEAERLLPYAAVADLFRTLADGLLHTLPAPQRSALRGVLRREPVAPEGPDPVALRLAVVTLLVSLGSGRPVLLVIDAAHLVDAASAQLLAFAARRTDPARVRTLVTETTAPGAAPSAGPSLCPRTAREFVLPPLSLTELSGWPGSHGLPHWLLRKVYGTSAGNPLFALELIRAATALPEPPARDDPLPLTERLRALPARRLDGLGADGRWVLLLAAVAAEPTPGLLRRAVTGPVPVRGTGPAATGGVLMLRDGGTEAAGKRQLSTTGTGTEAAGRPLSAPDIDPIVAGARRAGLLTVDGDALRFAHPMVAAALRTCSAAELRAAHACLAGAVSDPLERVRHLALAATGPDGTLADALAAGAEQARRRGAKETAAQLGRLALLRTPPARGTVLVGRALAGAQLAYDAADYELTRELARSALRGTASAAQRVQACLLVIHASNQALHEAAEVFDEMLVSVGDDLGLHAQLHYARALRAHITDGETALARVEAARAAALAHRATDRTTELMALSLEAFTAAVLGRADAAEPLARALSTPQDSGLSGGHNGPRAIKARLDLFADRHREAACALGLLLRRARDSGTVEDVIFLLCASIDVDLRAGRGAAALASAGEVTRLSREIGVRLGPVPHSLALAEAAGGELSRAAALAREGVAVARSRHDQIFLPLALCALGHVQLRSQDPAGAVEALGQARDIAERRGIVDPSAVPWAVDLTEALVAVGDHERAESVADEALRTAGRLARHGVSASLRRARALCRAAGADRAAARQAVSELHWAADCHRAGGLLIEHGRDLLALGTVEWRQRHTTAAATAWHQAATVFRECAAHPWLRQATAELSRIEPPAGGPHGRTADSPVPALTGIEHRIATMVAAGSTNREVATSLFLAVKTVESSLTRIYRKLGVRSRTELGVLLRTPPDGHAVGGRRRLGG
ncbi:LuxR family transcriptional regulator [Streptomyces sp. NPDC006649]|uniref:helix-turn-helix transcriptional regulator n=1 Tax=Streptomyces sp. NPDC006649 TaxID=3156896 RepID=UPI0033A2D0B3